jgi:hypothetical protein
LTIALTDEACAVLGFAVGTGCVATGTTVKVAADDDSAQASAAL